MTKKCFFKIVLGLLLVALLSGLAPESSFAANRRGARIEKTTPSETPAVSAPESKVDEPPPVQTSPNTARNAAAGAKVQLGVQVQNLNGTAYWRMLGRHTGRNAGVLVAEVASGSPAEQMGIKKHDVILSCNYRDITKPDEFMDAVSALNPGDKIVLLIYRFSPTLLNITGTMGQLTAAAETEQPPRPSKETAAAAAGMSTSAAIFAPTGHHVITAVDFSPDGQQIISGGDMKNSLQLWDAATGREIRSFTGDNDVVYAVAFSPDGKYVLSGSGNSTIKLWEVTAGKEIKVFPGPAKDDLVLAVAFSPDGRYFLSGGSDTNLKLWDIATGREIRTFTGHVGWISSVAFSPDGRYALSGSWDNTLKLWDIATGREIRSFVGQKGVDKTSRAVAKDGTPVPPVIQAAADKMAWGMKSFAGRVSSVAFSPDGGYALSGSWGSTITLWDVATGREARTFAGHKERVNSIAFSSDGSQIISAARDNTIKLWNVATGREIKAFKGHIGEINSTKFSKDVQRFVSGGSDGTIRLWDGNTGMEIVKFVSLKDGEWIVITPEGYYNSSRRGHEYLNVRRGNKVYGIDQFYDVFYRPDIVSAKLKGDDIMGLVTLTVDEAINNPPPTVKFSAVPSQTGDAKLKVCYRIQSTGGGIGEVRLFQNGKLIKSDGFYREVAVQNATAPVKLMALNSRALYQDMRSLTVKEKQSPGAVLAQAKGELVDECMELETMTGENEIGLTAFNAANTVQSVMGTTRFIATRAQEEARLYILAVGIDRYRDASINLKYAAKDARDFITQMAGKAGTIYQPSNIYLTSLANEQATKQDILAAIEKLAAQVKHNDSFIFFNASHGLLLQSQYYIVTSSFDGRLDTGVSLISSNEIVEMSKRIKALSQLFIFDTCHAGGVDIIVSGLYDARMSVMAKKMGLHIYASAGSVQTALDGYQSNGLYTHALLTGLKNGAVVDKDKSGAVTVKSLGSYSKEMTTELSSKLGHPQTPLIINFGKDSRLFEVR